MLDCWHQQLQCVRLCCLTAAVHRHHVAVFEVWDCGVVWIACNVGRVAFAAWCHHNVYGQCPLGMHCMECAASYAGVTWEAAEELCCGCHSACCGLGLHLWRARAPAQQACTAVCSVDGWQAGWGTVILVIEHGSQSGVCKWQWHLVGTLHLQCAAVC